MEFGRVAPCYAVLERMVFGGSLQRARVEHCELLARAAAGGGGRLLLLGEGDGRFLHEVVTRGWPGEILVVDCSRAMLQRCRDRVRESGGGGRVKYFCGDAVDFLSGDDVGAFDHVASHFFLDCFDRRGVRSLVERVAAVLNPGALFLVSDFQIPRSGVVGRLHALLLVRTMYWFFRVTCGLSQSRLVDPDPELRGCGFELEQRRVRRCGLVRSDAWRLAGGVSGFRGRTRTPGGGSR